MAPQPPSEPSSMLSGNVMHKDAGSWTGKLETGAIATFTASSDFWRGHLFPPVESSIDPTNPKPTALHDMTRTPEMKEPRPSTTTKTSPHDNFDPTVICPTLNTVAKDRNPLIVTSSNHHQAESSELDTKTTVLPMSHLQQVMTSKSGKMSTAILLPTTKHLHKAATPESEKKTTEVLPGKNHFRQTTTSESKMNTRTMLPATTETSESIKKTTESVPKSHQQQGIPSESKRRNPKTLLPVKKQFHMSEASQSLKTPNKSVKKLRLDHNHNAELKTEVLSSTFLHHVPISESPKNVIFQPMLHMQITISSNSKMNHKNVQLSKMMHANRQLLAEMKSARQLIHQDYPARMFKTNPRKEFPHQASRSSEFTFHVQHTACIEHPQLCCESISNLRGAKSENVLRVSFSHFSHPPYIDRNCDRREHILSS